VSLRGLLLALFAGLAAAHVAGVLFASPILPASGVLPLIALIAYAAVAGRHAPPLVRWSLLAGLLVLGLPAAAPRFGEHELVATTGYHILTSAQQSGGTAGLALRALGRSLWAVAPLLVGYGLLVAAVVALARRRPTRPALLFITAAALLATGYTAAQVWRRSRGGWPAGSPAELSALALPVLLLALMALAAAAIATGIPAADPGTATETPTAHPHAATGIPAAAKAATPGRFRPAWPASAGMILVALAALSMIDPALTVLHPLEALSGNTAAPQLAAEIGTSFASIEIVSFSAGAAAWAAATKLAAAALVVVACVRACPPTASTSPSAGQS
jgi:hypothetical protein